MKNKLSDLNDHLFAQIERLSDETLKRDVLELEIKRATAVSLVSSQIIGGVKVKLDALKLIGKNGITKDNLPVLIESFNKEIEISDGK